MIKECSYLSQFIRKEELINATTNHQGIIAMFRFQSRLPTNESYRFQRKDALKVLSTNVSIYIVPDPAPDPYLEAT